MPGFCVTVDMDRDVNMMIPGSPVAGSLDRGYGTSPRFESSIKGLHLLTGLFEEMGIPATFFIEGRTLIEAKDDVSCLEGFEVGVHGFDHEPFAHMARPDSQEAVRKSCDTVKDILGRPPSCFRAPYMMQPRNIGDFLKGTGIHVDSSAYANGVDCKPVMLPGYIAEIPVTEGVDSEGKNITGYLWPMHERKRVLEDFVELSSTVPEDGVFVIADHTWHPVESRVFGRLPEEGVRANLDNIRRLVESVLDAGLTPMTVSQATYYAF